MKKSYYLFNPGRMSRKDKTLKFITKDESGNEQKPKFLPVEGVSELFIFGSLDTNSALYTFLGKQGVLVHFFDYYENYRGSFVPRDGLLAGKMQVAQTLHYHYSKKRIILARKFIEAASFNMLKNLRYYANRDKPVQSHIEDIEQLRNEIESTREIDELMGIEGNIRNRYYAGFDQILGDLKMEGRSKQPPKNEVNALISFANMMCYTQCLKMIHHTQLNPTISFLHEPGYRRYSLALDLAEIFKPLLVDRVIFKVLNKKTISAKDFDDRTNRIILKDSGRKKFIKSWEEKLNETIMHRTLKRKVSYSRLIRLECYKLGKHILGIEEYTPFKAWW